MTIDISGSAQSYLVLYTALVTNITVSYILNIMYISTQKR